MLGMIIRSNYIARAGIPRNKLLWARSPRPFPLRQGQTCLDLFRHFASPFEFLTFPLLGRLLDAAAADWITAEKQIEDTRIGEYGLFPSTFFRGKQWFSECYASVPLAVLLQALLCVDVFLVACGECGTSSSLNTRSTRTTHSLYSIGYVLNSPLDRCLSWIDTYHFLAPFPVFADRHASFTPGGDQYGASP
jgi:hypothetical protein